MRTSIRGSIAFSLPRYPRAYAAFPRTCLFSSVVRTSIRGSIAFSLPIFPSASAVLPRTPLSSSVVRTSIRGSIAFSLPIFPRASIVLHSLSAFLNGNLNSSINVFKMLSGLIKERILIVFSLREKNSVFR